MVSALILARRISTSSRLVAARNAVSPAATAASVGRLTTTTTTLLQAQQQQLSVGRGRSLLGFPPHHDNVHRRFYSSTPVVKNDDYPEHTLFPMPALSPTMESGSIASWAIKEGDEFSAGDVLCSIETDKASVDFEAQDDGILAKILKQGGDGADIAIGTPICVVVEEADDVAAFADFVAQEEDQAPAAAPPAAEAATPAPDPAAAPATSTEPSPLMPAARHLSESKGLDATVLKGSGKGGRVTKGDVLQALAAGVQMPALQQKAAPAPSAAAQPTSATPAAAAAATQKAPTQHQDIDLEVVDTQGSYEDVANNKMRKVIASRLTESKREVPHFYTSVEVELDNVMKLRKQLQKDHDVKVSVNDLIIRCCALALRDVPEVNASYDVKTGEVKLQPTIDVSVAVATPTGLITPIVPNTDTMGLSDITSKVRDLAVRARDGKLQPQEYQGGTFCVSNLGMFGIDEFSAVINPPQAAILAVGGGSKRIVPTPYVDGQDEQQPPTIRTIMTGRLSADRRVVDEATASLFLSAFKHYISQPELLLL